MKKIFKTFSLITVFLFIYMVSFASPIDSVEKYGWGTNTGWVNFNPTSGNVDVTTTGLTGSIWSDNYGWINLQPTNGGITNDCSGNLGGYAWGPNIGWVDFSNASIDPGTGYFSGILTTDTVGNIQLTGTNIAVKTSWRCSSGGGGHSGGGHHSKNYTCKDSTAINFSNIGIHKQSLCKYAEEEKEEVTSEKQNKKEEEKALEDNREVTQETIGVSQRAKKVIENIVFKDKQCPHFNNYYRWWQRGPEVTKIQLFLFTQGFLDIKNIDGVMGPATFEAIKGFQAKYASDILAPWGFTKPTGRWYKTTRKKANALLGCPEPPVLLENGVWVN